jgi:hypothetical protein
VSSRRVVLIVLSGFAAFGAAIARAADTQEAQWHKAVEEYAASSDTDQDSNKRKHERIVKACGHDVQVVFDWSSFKMSEWVGTDMGAGYKADELTAGRQCVAILGPIADACERPEAKRKKLVKLKTITCASKPPASMPNDHGYQNVWKLTKGGTNIDSWIVPLMMSGLPRPDDWISEHL